MESNIKENSEFFSCPICKGKYITVENNPSLGIIAELCDFCKGKKQLDWCDIIVGVDIEWFNKNFNVVDLKIEKHNYKNGRCRINEFVE